MESLLELEFPFIKVVHESISKVFKANKRVVEIGINGILNGLKKTPKLETKVEYEQYLRKLREKL